MKKMLLLAAGVCAFPALALAETTEPANTAVTVKICTTSAEDCTSVVTAPPADTPVEVDLPGNTITIYKPPPGANPPPVSVSTKGRNR